MEEITQDIQGGQASRYRRYSDEEKAQALAVVDACEGGYKQAARETGIPWTTLREWHRGRGVKEEAVGEKRSEWRVRMIARLEEKIDLLVGAIDKARIESANLAQVSGALRTLVDKVEALREAGKPDWEEIEEVLGTERKQMCKDVAAVVKRHVHEPKVLTAIALDLEAVSKGRELVPVAPVGVPSSELAALEDVRLPSQTSAEREVWRVGGG